MHSTSPHAGSADRSRRFSTDSHGRFWWHHRPEHDYVPAIYGVLTDAEWEILEAWYTATEAADSIGEINVPAMSLVQGIISGNGVRRVVQLGHYYGYSTLLIGFWFRAMGQGGRLVSIDIDPKATEFTQTWVDRAGLNDQVTLILGDSASREACDAAHAAFDGQPPQVILLDSSHQYDHTLRELDLWVPAMPSQSLMLLHDTSTFARTWDSRGAGGVQQALHDWLPGRRDVAFLNLNGRVGEPGVDSETLVYRDGCGLGILQKS